MAFSSKMLHVILFLRTDEYLHHIRPDTAMQLYPYFTQQPQVIPINLHLNTTVS